MLETMLDRFSCYLVSIQAAKEEDREVVAYGLFRVVSLAIQYTLLIIPSLFLGCLPEIMSFTLMFAALKRYAGGTHASRYWRCLTTFTVLAYAASFILRFVPEFITSYVSISLTLTALVIVLLRAPVIHPNNPKSPRRKKQLRRKAVLIALTQTVIILICLLFVPLWADLYILCGASGGFAAAFTLILPMPPMEGGGNDEEISL